MLSNEEHYHRNYAIIPLHKKVKDLNKVHTFKMEHTETCKKDLEGSCDGLASSVEGTWTFKAEVTFQKAQTKIINL